MLSHTPMNFLDNREVHTLVSRSVALTPMLIPHTKIIEKLRQSSALTQRIIEIRSLNLISPTTYVNIPQSLKVGHFVWVFVKKTMRCWCHPNWKTTGVWGPKPSFFQRRFRDVYVSFLTPTPSHASGGSPVGVSMPGFSVPESGGHVGTMYISSH